MGIAHRDPEHVCERLTLFGAQRLGPASRVWAQAVRPQAGLQEHAHELCGRSAKIARTDGTIAGTPFYVALVPGYLNYLWQVRMNLRLAPSSAATPAISAPLQSCLRCAACTQRSRPRKRS
jgi:hypothetical protein